MNLRSALIKSYVCVSVFAGAEVKPDFSRLVCLFSKSDRHTVHLAPRRLPASSEASWRRRWGFLRWGWCTGSWEQCCQGCGPLMGPTVTKPPSGPQESYRADRWERWLNYNRAAGAVNEKRRRGEGATEWITTEGSEITKGIKTQIRGQVVMYELKMWMNQCVCTADKTQPILIKDVDVQQRCIFWPRS